MSADRLAALLRDAMRASHEPDAGCVNGHPLDDDNTRVEGTRRRCRACGVERQRRYRQTHKGAK